MALSRLSYEHRHALRDAVEHNIVTLSGARDAMTGRWGYDKVGGYNVVVDNAELMLSMFGV